MCLETRWRMMWLLVAFVCVGLSHGTYQEKEYGNTHNFRVRGKPDFIEFSPSYNSNVTMLWKRGDYVVRSDKKFIMTRSYFGIYHLTQKDSGRYIMRDKDLKEISSYTLEVKATTKVHKERPGGLLAVTFDLEPNSCNIYFFPESDRQPRYLKNEIVRQGRLQEGLDELDCEGFDLLKPCGISNKDLQMSCDGRYEIRDQNDNTALVVSLEMRQITKTFEQKPGDRFDFTLGLNPNSCNIYFFPESDLMINLVRQGRLQRGLDELDCVGFDLLKPCGISNKDLQMSCHGRYEIRDQNDNTALVVSLEMEALPYEPSRIAIGAGVFLASLFCYCVKCCCCGKSTSKEDSSETAAAAAAAAEPDVQYQEYDNEPVGPRSDQLIQPSGTHYPAQPSYTLTEALVQDHPTVDLPPAYSEISALAEQPDAPSFPVHSDPEPKFELKGVTFPSAPPLGSDSTYSNVYTSEKLNFL